MIWNDFLEPMAEFRVDLSRICILTPYRGVTVHIQEYLNVWVSTSPRQILTHEMIRAMPLTQARTRTWLGI